MSTQTERRSWRWQVWALVALGLGALYLLRGMVIELLVQVLLGAALAYALSPLCKMLERSLPRTGAALGALFIVLLGVAGLGMLLVPPLVTQIQLLIGQIPALSAQLRQLLGVLEQRFVAMGMPNLIGEDVGQRLGQLSGAALQGLAHSAGGMASGLTRLSLAAVLAYYFMKDREFFLHRLAMLVPLKHRRRALLAAAEMRREVGGYLRGQAVVSASVGLLTAIGLWIIGIPAWLALGLLMAICDLIPYFGPFIGAIPIALFSLSGDPSRLLWAMGVVVAAQQLEGNIISPRVIGQHTGLHPVTVLLALSAGGALLGLWGMLLALPVVVGARGCWRVWRYYEERQ